MTKGKQTVLNGTSYVEYQCPKCGARSKTIDLTPEIGGEFPRKRLSSCTCDGIQRRSEARETIRRIGVGGFCVLAFLVLFAYYLSKTP